MASRSESSHDASEAVNHLEKGDAASQARHLVVGLIRKAIGGRIAAQIQIMDSRQGSCGHEEPNDVCCEIISWSDKNAN